MDACNSVRACKANNAATSSTLVKKRKSPRIAAAKNMMRLSFGRGSSKPDTKEFGFFCDVDEVSSITTGLCGGEIESNVRNHQGGLFNNEQKIVTMNSFNKLSSTFPTKSTQSTQSITAGDDTGGYQSPARATAAASTAEKTAPSPSLSRTLP